MTYGNRVLFMNQENWADPMIEIFPPVTKFIFHTYDPSGTIQQHDAFCVLVLNILNEKIYIFSWFWLIILAIFFTIALLYSFAVVSLKRIRVIILIRPFRYGVSNGMAALANKIQIGDFLLLCLIAQNSNVICSWELLEDLSDKLSIQHINCLSVCNLWYSAVYRL